ncbi:MAG: hypothetical protein IRZ14_12195 [Chloroflexi bacterium]|nr:hypothetical protein [Chloroflexota bacterium]
MSEIDLDTAARALAASACNFLRRTADLTLSMSNARWRLAARTPEALTFRPVAPSGAFLSEEEALDLPLAEVARVTWDRLPRQHARSQIRFHFHSGELWIFSGYLEEPSLS